VACNVRSLGDHCFEANQAETMKRDAMVMVVMVMMVMMMMMTMMMMMMMMTNNPP
jgi:hypothetical protein